MSIAEAEAGRLADPNNACGPSIKQSRLERLGAEFFLALITPKGTLCTIYPSIRSHGRGR